jgi:hypothetical protein
MLNHQWGSTAILNRIVNAWVKNIQGLSSTVITLYVVFWLLPVTLRLILVLLVPRFIYSAGIPHIVCISHRHAFNTPKPLDSLTLSNLFFLSVFYRTLQNIQMLKQENGIILYFFSLFSTFSPSSTSIGFLQKYILSL